MIRSEGAAVAREPPEQVAGVVVVVVVVVVTLVVVGPENTGALTLLGRYMGSLVSKSDEWYNEPGQVERVFGDDRE